MDVLIIVLVVVGVLAILLELLMPGWDSFIGVFVAIAAFVVAAILAVISNPGAGYIIGAVVALFVLGGYGLFMFIRRRQLHGSMILTDVDEAPKEDLSGFMGKEGRAITVLRPSGDADFNGVRREVSSDGPFLEKGTKIRVIETHGNKIVVSAIEGN